MAAAPPDLTREVLGNIPRSSQILFYILATLAMGIFAFGIFRRIQRWRLGRPSSETIDWKAVLRRMTIDVLGQRRVLGRGLASLSHVLLFSGFVVLLIGTILIGIEHWTADILGRAPDQPVFHHGIYYAVYEVVLDTFGVAFVIGCLWFAKRRFNRPKSLSHNKGDWITLGLFLFIGLSGFALEGLRIIWDQTVMPGFSFVGLACARTFEGFGLEPTAAARLHFPLWWGHAVCSLAVVAAFPYSRVFHGVAGAINLAIGRKELGIMVPISLDTVEETGKTGAEVLEDFTRKQLLELDSCVSCGRCEESCPAFAAGKPLSPKAVVEDIRGHFNRHRSLHLLGRKAEITHKGADPSSTAALHGDTISAETLWSCTTCSACVDVCPLGVKPLNFITDMRRFLIGDGQLSGTAASALQKTQMSGNPWGMPQQERFAWAKDLNVPTVKDVPDFDVIYWIGCAASYDRRVQKVARAMIKLLQAASVRFAVLGPEEKCTGEAARRMGDEFAFQELAEANIQTLSRYKVKKIITHCPHCLNSFARDYPQFGGHFEVVHHTQYLAELAGRLNLKPNTTPGSMEKVTYHDPCYLARVNGITDAPRTVLRQAIGDSATSSKKKFQELGRHGKRTACCGAGGGRMWFDDSPSNRVGIDRFKEAADSGAKTVAVSCPFCLIMMGDGLAAAKPDVQTMDIAEILAAQLDTQAENDKVQSP